MKSDLKIKNILLSLGTLLLTLSIPSSQVRLSKLGCIRTRMPTSIDNKTVPQGIGCTIPLSKLIDRTQIESEFENARKAGAVMVRIAPNHASDSEVKLLLQSGFHKDANTSENWVKEIRENHPKIRFFNAVATAIEKNILKIKQVLGKVETPYGVDFEVKVTLNSLKNIGDFELFHLDNTRELNNIAVYPATNVPLYTLIAHGFIPSSISKNVWFRTPQATREIYKELFDIIQADLPAEFNHGLKVLTEDRDVQYDSFRKMYVLGMNKRGSRFDRAPAEIVLFTGNPETLRKIVDTNRQKLEEELSDSGYDQVFLGFGAGATPAAILPSAKDNLDQAVKLTLDSIKMNCRQDCEAPDFYFLHRSVQNQYTDALLKRVRSMKAGETTDPQADYSPLTLATKLDHLSAYKQKYERFLLNKDAGIDLEKRLVSPHVFVIPINEFDKTDLQEHFAPFLTFFVYDSVKQVESAMRDSRVQRKALYGSLFAGKKASPDLDQMVDTFKENRHGVYVNASSYEGVFSNMPFGGRGTDVSVVAKVSKKANSLPFYTSSNHPVLFSEEAYRAYPLAQQTIEYAPLNSPEYFKKELSNLLSLANRPPPSLSYPVASWSQLQEPLWQNRTTGINALQEVAKREGLFIVANGATPSHKTAKEQAEYFYGVPLIYTTANHFHSTVPKTKGLLIHPVSINEGPALLNLIRGTVNPHLGRGTLLGQLEGNKHLEYLMTEAIAPGLMPKTETLGGMEDLGLFPAQFLVQRKELKDRIDYLIKNREKIDDNTRLKLQTELSSFVESFFQMTRQHFPEGAYFKNFREAATGDFGTQITSFSSNSKRIAEEFLRLVESVSQNQSRGSQGLADASILSATDNRWTETGHKFVRKLLLGEKDLIIQKRVMIDTTPMGFPQEYRIDFIDGEPLLGRTRFSHEYLPDELNEAKEVLRDFFAAAPPELRHLSGGADVARTRDGKWIIIEFNFGASSGTLSPGYFPIESHLIMENLQGKPTAFLRDIREIHTQGVEAQAKYLKSRNHVKSVFWRTSPQDFSAVDIGKYFRKLTLENWAKNPTEDGAREALRTIKKMFEGLEEKSGEDIPNIIKGAEYYIIKKLGYLPKGVEL